MAFAQSGFAEGTGSSNVVRERSSESTALLTPCRSSTVSILAPSIWSGGGRMIFVCRPRYLIPAWLHEVSKSGRDKLPPSPPAVFQSNGAARRTTELEVQIAILKLMEDGKVWTNSALKNALPSILPLTSADRQKSPTRPNEERWEEQVNNALTRQGRR